MIPQPIEYYEIYRAFADLDHVWRQRDRACRARQDDCRGPVPGDGGRAVDVLFETWANPIDATAPLAANSGYAGALRPSVISRRRKGHPSG